MLTSLVNLTESHSEADNLFFRCTISRSVLDFPVSSVATLIVISLLIISKERSFLFNVFKSVCRMMIWNL